jgi:hypothetical protein
MKATGKDNRPFWIETPGRKDFLPCVVSSMDKGRFLTTNAITKDSKIRSGAFYCAEETIDEIIPGLFEAALRCSKDAKYLNSFRSQKRAFDYISHNSGFKYCPMWCLASDINNIKLENDEEKVLGVAKILLVPGIPKTVFLSKPDYVGLFTRLPGNYNSIILHNIEFGIAFV